MFNSLYNNEITDKIDWYKYFDKIYYIENNIEEELEYFKKVDIIKANKFIRIPIKLNKRNYELTNFYNESFLKAVYNAYMYNCENILIIPNSINFRNTSFIKETLDNIDLINNDIIILNPKDISEDCFILNAKAIKFISNLTLNLTNKEWINKLKNEIKNNLNIYKVNESICNHKIDLVIPYVNCSDKEWKDEYNVYNNKINERRYRDYNTLNYLFRSIEQNLSFINKLYLIVSSESQIPSWLNRNNVEIILHKDIIPLKYLPVFNSCTIEMFLPFIKNLSEYFIYTNDDVFFINKMNKNMFYKDGKSITYFNNIPNEKKMFNEVCMNDFKLCMKDFSKDYINNFKLLIDSKYKKMFHTAHPFFKSTCLHLHELYKNEILNSISRFRTNNNFNQYIYGLYDYIAFKSINKNQGFYYSCLIEIENVNLYNKLINTLCINDNNNDSYNECIKLLNNKLYDKFPNKSIYENKSIAKLYNIKEFKQKSFLTDKLYVSFTSWKKRIRNCKHTVDLMMKQSMLPDKIILNLSEEEFPLKEKELPIDLVAESYNNKRFEIFWVKENTTVWKKIIPTMNRFPFDLIFSIDDDIEYPPNYIEEMYKTFCENDKKYPVVAYESSLENNLCHSGPFTLTSKIFYGSLLDNIYKELISPTLKDKKWQSDIVYYKVLNKLGNRYIKCKNINGNFLYKSSSLNKENSYSIWNNEYKLQRREDLKLINEYLDNNYLDISSYKKVIYTCITGNYDDLKEPEYITEGFDYICFTDNENLKSNNWKILPIPEDLLGLSKVKQQRNIKINTHKYLSQYDLSIWIDSSVELKGDINEILKSLDFSRYNIFITKHPQRKCIYEEGKACVTLNKDNSNIIKEELDYFRKNNMPDNFGLYETNVIVKLHNERKCIRLMEAWSKYLNRFSHRDQISLPYCIYELNYKKICKMPINFNHTKYFNWIGGSHKNVNICIVHYNTPELTNALIMSINKYVKRAKIYLFDNSTNKPFNYKYDNLIYLDNTKGQYIDFDSWLETYPTRLESKEHIGNYGSARHSISVEKCMEIINDEFILMDSDILLKRDISGFINKNYVYVGESELQKNGKYRVLPFCLYINVNMCKQNNISWFDANYMHGLHITKEADKYDTGGAFYVHTRDLPFKEVKLKSFIIHYKGGSWEETYMKIHNLQLSSKEWLEINKKYYE